MFNFELYKEGLRKTKTLGILFIVGMLLGAVAQPLIEISNHINSIRMGWRGDWNLQVVGLNASYMMVFAPFAGAPVITLSIFSFLNKRSDSDFYHAIPHKRETLFGSFIASIITWVVGGMWVSTAVSVIIYTLSSHADVFMGWTILVVLGMSAASLLVIASTALAMTITGNRLSNIVATGLILFLPRGLMIMFVSMIVESTRVVSSTNFGILGNHHYNILLALLGSTRMWWDTEDVFTAGTMYTLILGTFYLVVARILFKKRQSELAGSPGSKFIQPIIRIAVTFVITLPAIFIIINNHGDYMYRLLYIIFQNNIMIIVFYIIAAISYFAYEFFTMKRIPKLTKMIPGLLMVVVLNIVFIAGITLSRNVILREVNEANIRSVTIIDLNTNYQWWGRLTYAELNMRGFEITDEATRVFFGETLNQNINWFRDRDRRRSFQFWNNKEVRVRLNIDGGRNITRNVWGREAALNGHLIEYEPYQEIFRRMPENPNYLTFQIGETGVRLAPYRVRQAQEQVEHIYDVLREEVIEVNFSDWHAEVTRINSRGGTSAHLIEVQGHNYLSMFPITEELTPNTFELVEYYLGIQD